MRKGKKNRGFSLVELIVTIAIMAVLVGILAPSLLRYVEKTREAKDAAAVGEFINELYLAASNLENYNDMPTGTQSFEYDSTNQVLSVTPKVNGVSQANSFSREVADIVGGDIKLSSQMWKNSNFKIEVNPTWDTIRVVGTDIPDGFDYTNCTIVQSNP